MLGESDQARMVKKPIRANSRINATASTATAANTAPSCSTKTWCRDNKTADQPSLGSRSARSTRPKHPALDRGGLDLILMGWAFLIF